MVPEGNLLSPPLLHFAEERGLVVVSGSTDSD
jgi:hypothetical protein